MLWCERERERDALLLCFKMLWWAFSISFFYIIIIKTRSCRTDRPLWSQSLYIFSCKYKIKKDMHVFVTFSRITGLLKFLVLQKLEKEKRPGNIIVV